MNPTNKLAYIRHKYSGPRKSRKKVQAAFKRHHGSSNDVYRVEAWRNKKQKVVEETADCPVVFSPHTTPDHHQLSNVSTKTLGVVKLEKETKPSMCRICLVENVRMHVVADKSLQELYEKMTDIPFVAEDNRPMLACFICYTKLKQCCQLQRQCLQAEELFAQMLNKDYELNPAMYRSQLQWCGRFITTPIVNIRIVNDCQVENDAFKVDIPAVSETQYEAKLIQLKKKLLSDELDTQHDSNQELEDFPLQYSESNSEDDVPERRTDVMKFEEEEEQPAKQTTKLDTQHDSNQELEDFPLQHSESNSEDDVPLMVMKFEEEEEQPANQTTSTSVAKKPELGIRKAKQEDITPAHHENNGLSDSESILTTESVLLKLLKFEDRISTCNLNQHVLIHTGEKSFKCQICQKSFTRKPNLNAHVRLHTGEKPYESESEKLSSSNQNLESHVLAHSGTEPYMCDICGKSFGRKSILNEHVRVLHIGGKPYKCEICDKTFLSSQGLQRHVRLHTAAPMSLTCDICQKNYSDKNYLKVHMRVHTGEKPYKCDICQKRFNMKQYLISHVRIHTGEKPYKCDICQKRFTKKQYLISHVRIHTGEKPYKCDICSTSFTQMSCLRRHARIQHTGEPKVLLRNVI